MVAIKAHQAESFLRAPDAKLKAVLFYGTDAGLVAERAQKLARHAAERESPPSEVLRMDDADLDGNPDRLAIEVQTVAMFGGAKIVRAIAGRRITGAALKPLVQEGLIAGLLVVEAGNLKPDDTLRALFEKAPNAAAVACYGDEARDIDGVIDEVLDAAGLRIALDARQLLASRLGADRALSRGEIEKLALYAAGKKTIDADDVEAIVGDASELAIDRVVLAAAAGDISRAISEYGRTVASGESPQAVIAAAQRHLQRLHKVKVALDNGRSLDDAVRQIRPPLHFKLKDQIGAQCRIWTAERLMGALSKASAAARASRSTGAMDEILAERMLVEIALLARAGKR